MAKSLWEKLLDSYWTKARARKSEVYDLLIGRINFDEVKSVCLYCLGHPYFYRRLKKEHPNLVVQVVEDTSSFVNYGKLKAMLQIVNICNKEYLPTDMEQFDLIIMNPPYDGKSSLHLKILNEAINHAGKIVSLQPAIWLKKSMLKRPMGKWRETFNNKLSEIEILDHRTSNDLFGLGNMIEELGVFTFTKGSSNLNLIDYGFESKDEYSLYNKIDISTKTETFNANKDGNNGWVKCLWEKSDKSISYRRKNDLGVFAWHKANNCYDGVVCEDSDPKFVIYFDTAEEKQNFLDSLKTDFMNWYFKFFVAPGDYKEMNYMWRIPKDYVNPRTGKKGYEGEWTDADFYKFFNLTPEEIKIVEETMKDYE